MIELWVLLNFVSPHIFDDASIFPEDDVEVFRDIQTKISSHLMRRSWVEVENSVIPKDERIIFLGSAVQQRKLFRLAIMKESWRLKATEDFNSLSFSNSLHHICIHSYLIPGADHYLARILQLPKIDLLVNCSAKLVFLDGILPLFKRLGKSVLIFSQRMKILNLLSKYCSLRKYTSEILMSELTNKEKQLAISQLCNQSNDVFIFLISTHSGAEGLNLTRASVTIIFDPD
jgi:SNF2 family DNA or RNA helicase